MRWVDENLLTDNDYLLVDTSRINLEWVITEDLLLNQKSRNLCIKCEEFIINLKSEGDENRSKNKVSRKFPTN